MKRLIILAVLPLFCGAVLTVGIAWAISATVVIRQGTPETGQKRMPAGDWARYDVWRRPGIHRIRWDDFFDVPPRAEYGPTLPTWSWVASRSAFNKPGSARRGSAAVRIETAVGWPLLSLRYCSTTWRIIIRGDNKITFEPSWSAFALPDHVTDPPYSQHKSRALPLIPVWPGFLLNTLMYTAALSVAITGLLALRRVLPPRSSCRAARRPR